MVVSTLSASSSPLRGEPSDEDPEEEEVGESGGSDDAEEEPGEDSEPGEKISDSELGGAEEEGCSGHPAGGTGDNGGNVSDGGAEDGRAGCTVQGIGEDGGADIDGLSKKSSLSVRKVERWFRRRRSQDRPGVLKKFREASWRFMFYLLAFIGGIVALYDKEWFYDTREVWTGFPKQSMLESQYWYYILEMSFYGSLLFSVAFDVKRKQQGQGSKDFKEQIIHHLATLVLLSFSWCVNYIRIGTLVMLIHDASDVLLESAKLFNYAKWEKTCQSLFVLFAIVFMVTRLIIFPFWLIHCTWVYPVHHYPAFFGYYFFNVMLVVLLCLHIFWAYLILCMIRKFMFGTLTRDERSDNEDEEENESSLTEDEEGQHKLDNGLAFDEKEDQNFGCLSPPENIYQSKNDSR
ncbi:ceramide synthase 2-like isoform X2 [Thunnus maccoyii]|uniref:ceramide synthase 2-like isoform X2 n=1 Tax=Thunnus maccoyii TaxID=8240 RepID=UPI001C4B2519|nr:ceramide synthase 2-like isoform X2 [Thunnus maccoyii]